MKPERWQEIERLYHLAREKANEERAAFLEQACAGDDAIRKEVESLLACRTEAAAFIETPALERVTQTLTGRSLLHYRIGQKIGQGGMGVVYRACDERLHREVAIKMLPDSFASDPERKARFEREARLLATLNTPGIAAIYGLEQAEGWLFLVLELVEGITLAERLRKGPLPVDKAVDICRQVAEGLEAAHERGVIHRDLKPANIMLTQDGKVKILDFGLAKAFEPDPVAADLSDTHAITDRVSRPGVILGTAAYMSPEQAKGRKVDKRTDIWAFGCLLFECLTGKRAFPGDTITEVIAKILEVEPYWEALPAATPAVVRSLLRKCLQKDAGRRLRDIADGRMEMLEGLPEPEPAVPAAKRTSMGWIASIGAAMLVAGILIGSLAMKYFTLSLFSPPAVRSIIRMGSGLGLYSFNSPDGFRWPTRTALALSSDGRFLVYSAIRENSGEQEKSQLYLRRLDQLEAKPIAGTQGGTSPFLSPDDRWVGFIAGYRMMKVPVEGGVPIPLCNGGLFGVSWGLDNWIYFVQGFNTGIERVSAEGGKPETLTTPDLSRAETGHRLPFALPGGKGILFTIFHAPEIPNRPRMAVLDLGTRKWRVLLENAAEGRYIPTGHIVFLRNGALMAARFNLDRMEITGQPVPVGADVVQSLDLFSSGRQTGTGQFSVSASGTLVYAPGGTARNELASFLWVDQQGRSEPVSSFKAVIYGPRLSPDGRKIAYFTCYAGWQIWVYDLPRGLATKITPDGIASWPNWTPDSRRLIFGWAESGPFQNLYWQPIDTSSPMERLTTSTNTSQSPASLSPDGQTMAFVEVHPSALFDIRLLSMRDRRVTPLTNLPVFEIHPMFSPDGRWVAYLANETGKRAEVYVKSFPGPGPKTQISSEGGVEPLWSPDGKKLYYRWQNQVWAADVQTGAFFSAGKPYILFEQEGLFDHSVPGRSWDISPDGKRFLTTKREERKSRPITELVLVQNWFEELRRLAPAGR